MRGTVLGSHRSYSQKSRRRLFAEFLDPSSALDIESESDNETDGPPPLVPMVDDPLNIPLPDDSSEEISRTNRRILEKAISSLSDRIKFPLVLKYSDFMKSERDNEAGIFKFLHDRISETTLSNLAGLKRGNTLNELATLCYIIALYTKPFQK